MRRAVSSSFSGWSESVVAFGFAAAPRRSALEQLRPGRGHEQKRRAAQPVDELVDEIEETIVRPVEVFEDDDAGPAIGDGFEEAPPCGRCGLSARLPIPGEPDERLELALQPAPLRLLRNAALEDVAKLPLRLVRSVRFEDSRLRLHDLAERPERDALAVWKASPLTPGDQIGIRVDHPEELAHEARLSDPGNADEGHQLRGPLLTHAPEQRAQQLHFPVATNQQGRSPFREVETEACDGLYGLPDLDELCLALRVDRLSLAVLDRVAGGAEGRLANEHAVDGRRRLHPCGRVDDVAGDHRLALGRARTEVDERHARVDRDPHLEL